MTPTSESALEMGWLCTTTLMAQTTATMANNTKRMTSILRSHFSRKPGDQEARNEQIQHRHREHEFPGKTHQLVVAEARQRSANPHEYEENSAGFGAEPEEWNQPGLHDGQGEEPGHQKEENTEYRIRDRIPLARGGSGMKE